LKQPPRERSTATKTDIDTVGEAVLTSVPILAKIDPRNATARVPTDGHRYTNTLTDRRKPIL